MVRWPDAKCEVTGKEKKSREAKNKRCEEKRGEEGRDSLETEPIENSHFIDGKVKQNHGIDNIPITILANKTAEQH